LNITQLQDPIGNVDKSIGKVNREIDDVKKALEPEGGGAYLGMSGAELRDYLKELVIERRQLRDEKAALLKKEADLLANRDRAALAAI
jgi:regulator of replication initiation timing